jgi:superfamily II DNA or RNA helicase
MVGHYGRDRRRRLSKEELLEQYARADGRCQNCGGELGANWHSAHLAAWVNGGSTSQTQAWCPTCNLRLGPRDVEQVADVKLRQWQSQAFGPIFLRLWDTGSATLHAAPGAGKTLFTGAIFRHGYDIRLFNRLLVVVPNVNLVDQWVEALGERMRIHLDRTPRDGVIEHPETVGAVVCYQSLPNAAQAHAVRMRQTQTLVVFDEIHHVADNASWGRAVGTMVGDPANGYPENAIGVLNMTGTLFRSGKRQRIRTVRYDRVEEDKLQAVPDWSVTTSHLIGVELRAPDLYVYGGRTKLVDLENEKVIDAEIADLSGRERSMAMRQAFKSRTWLTGYCKEALRLLKNHLLAVNWEVPLKLLFVADGQREAKIATDIINQIMQRDFARLVISDEPEALRTLKRAARETEPCAIVAVQMVTEGFDCPEVSTIAHASRKAAQLFVAQEMARAMRLTDFERARQQMLPAQILIPDDQTLREAFASALASALHVVDDSDELRCHDGQPGCLCRYPDMGECICPPGSSASERLVRFEVLDLDDPRLERATVLGHEDGDVPAPELRYFIEQCAGIGIPETYAPRVAVVTRRGRPATRTYATEKPVPTVVTEVNPRDIVQSYRAILRQAAGWMEKHIGHDSRYTTVGVFQGRANDAGGIPSGGRDQASMRQLATVADWMTARIREHCRDYGEKVPAFAEEKL